MCFRSAPEVKRGQVPYKISFFSRKYPVAQKLEQLEQNRKKNIRKLIRRATNVSL